MNIVVGMLLAIIPLIIWHYFIKFACERALNPALKDLQERLETIELQLRDLQRSSVRIREEMQGNYRTEKETK